MYPELVSDVAGGWWDSAVSDNNVDTKLRPDRTLRVHNCVLVWCRTQNWNIALSSWEHITFTGDRSEDNSISNHHGFQTQCTVPCTAWLLLTSESDWEIIWIVECEDLFVSALIFKIEGDRWWVHKDWNLHNALLHATHHAPAKEPFHNYNDNLVHHSNQEHNLPITMKLINNTGSTWWNGNSMAWQRSLHMKLNFKHVVHASPLQICFTFALNVQKHENTFPKFFR